MKTMWSLYKMEMKAAFRNPSIIFLFLFPTILLILMGSYAQNTTAMNQIFANVLIIDIIVAGTSGFGQHMMEVKQSVLIKRIGITRITPMQAMLIFLSRPLTILIFSIIYLFLLVYLFTIAWMPALNWSIINWGTFFYGVIQGMAVSFILGFVLVTISRNTEIFQMYSVLYLFLCGLVGGLFLPNLAVPWMYYSGFALPSVYSAHLISVAFSGSNVWFYGTQPLFTGAQSPFYLYNVVSLTVPWAFVGLFLLIVKKRFSWTN